MIYTKKELSAINDAMCELSTYINPAFYMLEELEEKYLEDDQGLESLMFMLRHNPERIRWEIHAISQMILEMKKLSDMYTGTDSSVIIRYFENAEDNKKIYQICREAV